MPTYVALLRGINVGGRNRLLMTDLRSTLAELKFKNVETYVQSGNIVFDSRSNDVFKLETRIRKQIKSDFGFELPVVVRSGESFSKIANQNPLLKNSGSNSERLHVTFFNSAPSDELLKSLAAPEGCRCKFKIGDAEAFIQCVGRYSDSKLTNAFFESRLKVSCTTRNWKTILALNKMISDR